MNCSTTNCAKTIVCDVAMLSVKTMVLCSVVISLEITLILQPALGDVKIGPVRAHESRL